MAAPRKTPNPPNGPNTPPKSRTLPGVAHVEKRKLGIAARDAAKKAGVDVTSFADVDALIAWYNNEVANKNVADPQAKKPPAEAAKGGSGDKPKPLSARENKANSAFLITNGVDKKRVEKMTPEERKTLRDQMLEDAQTGEGDPARDDQNDVLEDPPEEKIKVKGGNAAQKAAADKIAPKQKGKSGKGAGSGTKAQRPKQVEISDALDDMDDPDLDEGEGPPKPDDKAGKGLSGFFGAGSNAKDWKSWAEDPTQGMPERMLGYFQTPGTARAIHALTRRPIMAAAAGFGAYKLGQPLYRAMTGQQQGQQKEASPIPEGADGYQYWDSYDPKVLSKESQPPVKRDRFNETPWWENEELSGEKSRESPPPEPIPADNNSTSTDIIRRLRGTA